MGFSVNPSKAPSPAKVYPIDINATENSALTADIFGYGLSDKDFASRFPGLVQTRDADIQQSYKNLNSPLDSTVQNSFVTKGLGQSLSAFGGGGEGATGVEGIGRNTVASSVAKDTLGYQDNARAYNENLYALNPERGLGLSGEDASNLAIANTGNLSAANQQAYAAKVAQQNANIAAANQKRAAVTGAAISVASSLLSKV